MIKAEELRKKTKECQLKRVQNEYEFPTIRSHNEQKQVRDHLNRRRNLIPEEIKRFERVLLEHVEKGNSCRFSLGSDIHSNWENDPVHLALVKYCEDAGLKYKVYNYKEPVGFHQEMYRHCLVVTW
ncbi:MAG: hypothetical protein DWQ19_11155 [Crenarchaeota archaeon]|nr:MAG: hypothetical protein DWQ19_11155 [Thermoproteota archaeon]